MNKTLVALAAMLAAAVPSIANADPFRFTATFGQIDPFSQTLTGDEYSVDAILDASLVSSIPFLGDLYEVNDASGTLSTSFNPDFGTIVGVADGQFGPARFTLHSIFGTMFDLGFSSDNGYYAATRVFPLPAGGRFGEVGGPLLSFSLTPVAAAVPEPATWGLMILGFGAVGAGLRRRRTRVAFA